VRRWTAALSLLLVLPVITGCRDDTVPVTFRPRIGSVYRYEITVRSRTEVRLPGEKPQVRSDEIHLQSEQTVLNAGANGVRVKVVLGDAKGGVRTFVVRFDRAAQLESVESEDTTSAAAGESATQSDSSVFGISEIFPAAAGAPPARQLHPGEGWPIDDRVTVPGSVGRAHLTGDGRLVALGYDGDAAVARIESATQLRFSSAQDSDGGERVLLDGVQVTDQHAAHDLKDGAVRTASSTTRGTFALEIQPPIGQVRDPVHGTLTVTVTSRTRRLA